MATKKPLVFNETLGIIEQLQSTDNIMEANYLTATNANAGAIVKGCPVYVSAANSVDKARANAIGTTRVVGLVVDTTVAAAGTASIQMDGVLTATTVQWDAITGQSGGLTAGSIYYLDPATAGKLTTTPPSTASQFAVVIGTALSTTDMLIEVARPIKL